MRPMQESSKRHDGSSIGCKSCQIWFQGTCAHLSEEEVKGLGTKRNCVWFCDSCLKPNDNIFTSSKTEGKLNGLFDSLSNKYTASITELFPKAVKEYITSHLYDDFKKAVNDTLPSLADISADCSNAKINNFYLQFIINVLTESKDSYVKQI